MSRPERRRGHRCRAPALLEDPEYLRAVHIPEIESAAGSHDADIEPGVFSLADVPDGGNESRSAFSVRRVLLRRGGIDRLGTGYLGQRFEQRGECRGVGVGPEQRVRSRFSAVVSLRDVVF